MNDSLVGGRPAEEPKLRHEFVGMMFAVTIAEVGLQTAALVQAGDWLRYLPAYSHLVLATVVIAASWVGWSRSLSPGAREDISTVFHRAFGILLVDVLLVIVYFILVRCVDFSADRSPRIAPSSTVANCILVIFGMYLVWDILAKSFAYRDTYGWWLREHGLRILPTLFCLVLAWQIKRLLRTAHGPYLVTADFTLISLVLLFRALKDIGSAWRPSHPYTRTVTSRKVLAVLVTLACGLALLLGLLWTRYSWPLPEQLVAAIENTSSK